MEEFSSIPVKTYFFVICRRTNVLKNNFLRRYTMDIFTSFIFTFFQHLCTITRIHRERTKALKTSFYYSYSLLIYKMLKIHCTDPKLYIYVNSKYITICRWWFPLLGIFEPSCEYYNQTTEGYDASHLPNPIFSDKRGRGYAYEAHI